MIDRQLIPHRALAQTSGFHFTDAVRPGPAPGPTPREGYRLDTYRRRAGRLRIPVLAAAVTRERLFETFLRLMEPLGDDVDVVLETSHQDGERHRDLRRRHIDRPVLESYFHEFEDLLLNDGCTGVAVLANSRPMELQFDEHKTLVCYARDLKPFVAILESTGIARDDKLPLVFDGPHLHFSKPEYGRHFDSLAWRLGVGAEADMVAG